jgi:hypothetical protein
MSKNPEVKDQALLELAEIFRSDETDPTPGSELLEPSQLDFTVASLGVVDDHLDAMRNRQLKGKTRIVFVLRCGAYVGEVIRRHAPGAKEWHWLDYDTAAKMDRRVAALGKTLETYAVLWDGAGTFYFPLGKVVKYLQNGREDSVKFFAEVVTAGLPEKGACNGV